MSKKVTVHTNDPKKSELSLNITGIVNRFAEITPRMVRLNGAIEENISQKILIEPNMKYPFSILGFWLQKGDNIRVDFKNVSAKEKGWELMVTNTQNQSGKYFDQIILKTDYRDIPEITLRVYGDISNKKHLKNRPPNVDNDGPPILENKKTQFIE